MLFWCRANLQVLLMGALQTLKNNTTKVQENGKKDSLRLRKKLHQQEERSVNNIITTV